MKFFFSFLMLTLAVAKTVEGKHVDAKNLTNRIINGELAAPGQFPYQILLIGTTNDLWCGGSLLKEDIVLTSALCCHNVAAFYVHYGITNLGEDHVYTRSSSMQIHEDYRPYDYPYQNDLCLVHLEDPILDPNVEFIKFPGRSQVGDTFEGEIATISGFGQADTGGPYSVDMRFANVGVISNAACEAGGTTAVIDECNLCIDTTGGTTGYCLGDEGGPMVIKQHGKSTQIAIAGFNNDMIGCKSGSPHIFTRITCHYDWLEQNAGITIDP